MKPFIKALPYVLAALVLAGCGTTGGIQDEGQQPIVDDQSTQGGAAGQDGAGAQTSGLQGPGGIDMQALNDPASLLSKRVLYFDFDSSKINEEERAIVTAHAGFLANNPVAKMTLEGHADERGTREYNIGLGERRALAVRQLLLFMGARDDQIQTISYGEEKPASLGHDDSSWRLNRRVEILYEGL